MIRFKSAIFLSILAFAAFAQSPKLFLAPNHPIGTPKGAHPGQVAWIHAPGVAQWDGETGLWVEDRWNSQELADRMVSEAVAVSAGGTPFSLTSTAALAVVRAGIVPARRLPLSSTSITRSHIAIP